MGFRVALIAIKGRSDGDINSDFGVAPTGEREEIAESPVCGAFVSTGWYLLYLNDYPRPDDAILQKLSKNAELVFCDVNETCMDSFATCWIDGSEQWLVFHDAQQSLMHLVTSGDLPPQYPKIHAGKTAAQDSDDGTVDHIFDIPIDLFESITGVRYDRDLPGSDEEPIEVFTPV